MYHADKYEAHNEALKKFIEVFNEVAKSKGNELEMYHQKVENFRDDGGIIYRPNNMYILYDFEKRFSHYDSCKKFKFKTLGQFERKLRKPEIKLSIQCSLNEHCFMVAWHQDFINESKQNIGSVTANGKREYSGKRFTKDFIELTYKQMDKFYDILIYAFQYNKFNKASFGNR